MRRTISPADMKQLETEFMRRICVPGALLMEHAAMGVVQALQRRLPQDAAVLFICGPGANGGDGYAAARLWKQLGGKSIVWETGTSIRGDALTNRSLCICAGVEITQANEYIEFPACDAAVDGIFGTGLNRPVSGMELGLIRMLNTLDKPVIAIDIPSGLNGTTGKVMGEAVHAVETVTFHRIKTGLLVGQGPDYTGKVTLQPIIIPEEEGEYPGFRYMLPEDLKRLPARRPTANKGTFGRVVIFAGSPGMAGAAAFCARACIRSGAGLTAIAVRESMLPLMQLLVPGATCIVLPEKDGVPQVTDALRSALSHANAAVIGCGMSADDSLLPVVELFMQAACPVVWDADALNLLSRHLQLMPLPDKDVVTPHLGEAARLLGISVADVTGDAIVALKQLRRRLGCHVLLKGARTLMAGDGDVAINLIGTPAMAKGGSGDILAGVIAAVLSQYPQMDTLMAMQTAALVHGMAGVAAEKKCGECCVTAEDMIDAIRIE